MRLIILGALVGVLGVPAFGQGVDPLIGTWKLNLEKSTGPVPKSLTTTYVGQGQNFSNTVEGVARSTVQNRKPAHLRWNASPDDG